MRASIRLKGIRRMNTWECNGLTFMSVVFYENKQFTHKLNMFIRIDISLQIYIWRMTSDKMVYFIHSLVTDEMSTNSKSSVAECQW